MAILTKQLKLQIPAGKATPTPPIGPALGQAGINIGEFITKFNAATAQMTGTVVPVVISVYDDRSFDFILKTPPVANSLMKAAGVEKGSGATGTKRVGTVSKEQVKKIAEEKMPDLNTTDPAAAMRMVAGTARSMGIEVK
ncbi:MAG: 50S ribosomal protein L11 [Candidatus Vogelbacteria bacterium CG10_big_fil_rev_8_21_14_0_10_51_16]|uniref:Large ribosomal subunit protein uL11 n=1 Tax=Candidatus Vogelbacteria bacterium CG10_big_fil_rev_8_21_14_0_10_51_16 TaxID=1975045 RepID=A0A2H0RD19_9BACT|nr:MAG: 50S ribosomal protein L11 [Candidatus Vogelbacteria bacterium CG10_big_fil_rev_8_21_14_0_10_51_16]